jgi:hypothetical protein
MVAPSSMTMMRKPSIIMLIVLAAALATPATPAQTRNILSDNYSIMVPEKGSKQKQKIFAQKVSKQKVSKQKVSNQKVSKREQPRLTPKYKSPTGTEQQVNIPRAKTVNPPRASGTGLCTFLRRGRRLRICRHQAGGPRLLRIALHVAPTKLVFMGRPAAPEAPIWVLAFNSGHAGIASEFHAKR